MGIKLLIAEGNLKWQIGNYEGGKFIFKRNGGWEVVKAGILNIGKLKTVGSNGKFQFRGNGGLKVVKAGNLKF